MYVKEKSARMAVAMCNCPRCYAPKAHPCWSAFLQRRMVNQVHQERINYVAEVLKEARRGR